MNRYRPSARISGAAALIGAAALLTGVLPASASAAPPRQPPVDVVPGEGTATPALVSGITEPAAATGSPADAARGHLAAKKSRYAIADPARDLTPKDTVRDGDAETVRFQQKHRGVEVFGGQYLVRMTGQGADRVVTGTAGKYFTGLQVSTEAEVPAATAVQRAVASVRGSLGGPGAPRLVPQHPKGGPKAGSTDLKGTARGPVVLPRGRGVLAHHVTVTGFDPLAQRPVKQEVYVDARAGHPVLSYSGIRTMNGESQAPYGPKGPQPLRQAPAPGPQDPAQQARGKKPPKPRFPGTTGKGVRLDGKKVGLEITEEDGAYLLRDYSRAWKTTRNALTTWDATGVDVGDAAEKWPAGIREVASKSKKFGKAATDSGAVDAHWAAGEVHDYFKKKHGRDSLDGRGMAINSLVGVTEYGFPYVNAFWDGEKMVYGGGNEEFKTLSADLDVVGHEMTHGVVQHTANLVYTGQSGALNEAVADYFGNAIDVDHSRTPARDAGLIGENLCRTLKPRECAMRDLNDGRTTSKDFLGVTHGNDNGGVHLNSTIVGGAFWDIREELGGKLADRIVYKALSEYLTPLDGFTAARHATVAAAKDLGVKGRQLRSVERAFTAHGIVPGWEQAIGVDSDPLATDLNTRGVEAGAGGGWWAASRSNDDGSEAYSVYAGRTDGKGPGTRISPNDGRYHVSPDTDGTTVVWVAVGPQGSEVLSRPVRGGPVRSLRTTASQAGAVHVSGTTVTWQEADADRKPRVAYLRGNERVPRFADNGDADITTALPTLHGDKLAYAKLFRNAEGYQDISTEILDLSTGKQTLLPAKGGMLGISSPVITGKHLYWLVDDIMDDNRQTLRRANLDGTGMTDVVPEDSDHSYIWTLDATDQALSYAYWKPRAGGGWANDNLPKLVQSDVDGKNPQRVSCNRGEQYGGAADTGTRVVWIDGTTGHTDLVTRERPAGRC
ncbi:M4 family metallopeptidase [Streptomyces sp. NPDC051561]|uniref:M4 family metallopeptidase n=1 Tax=Streptomyces sp. NPDC051561 TaxID=3365658 RepID=UPI0037959047